MLKATLLLQHLADCDDGLGARAHAQRTQHGGHVVLDGFHRQAQFAGDQLVGLALVEQVQHIGLARRETQLLQRGHGLEIRVAGFLLDLARIGRLAELGVVFTAHAHGGHIDAT